jgi:hypothetical protein
MTTTTDDKALYRAFVACLIVVSLPIKNLAYVAPALYLLILWQHGERRIFYRVALLSAAMLVISFIAILWDHASGRTVNFPGPFFGLMTYAPLFVLLCETFDRTIDQPAYERFAAICAKFILIQSAVGICQFIVTSNPDAVCGTFGLLDGLRLQITIAQVYFTFTIFGMILFLVPVAQDWLIRISIAIGALTCVLAQSGHQTIFFVAALVGCGLARVANVGTLVRTAAAAGLIILLVMTFYPDSAWLAREWYGKMTDSGNSPKRLAIESAASAMAEPKVLLVGTGLGQFSSRAALISSNEYLNIKLPEIITGRSDYFDEQVWPYLLLFNEVGEGSAMAKPYMSVVSLPVELGAVLFSALFAVICLSIVRCGRIMVVSRDQLGQIGFGMTVGIIFFVLCCLIENYAEFSQAIFVPFILFIVAGSRAKTLLRDADAANSSKSISKPYAAGARLVRKQVVKRSC